MPNCVHGRKEDRYSRKRFRWVSVLRVARKTESQTLLFYSQRLILPLLSARPLSPSDVLLFQNHEWFNVPVLSSNYLFDVRLVSLNILQNLLSWVVTLRVTEFKVRILFIISFFLLIISCRFLFLFLAFQNLLVLDGVERYIYTLPIGFVIHVFDVTWDCEHWLHHSCVCS